MFVLKGLWEYSAVILLLVCLVSIIWAFVAGIFRFVAGIFRSIDEHRKQGAETACREAEEARLVNERRRLRKKDEKERKEALCKHQEVVEKIADLKASCVASWDQVTRTAEALHGGSRALSFADALKHDVLQILSSFSTANGNVTKDLGRLYQAISRRWGSGRRTIPECIYEIENFEREEICLPATVRILHISDRLISNGLAARAAAAFSSLVVAAAGCCDASFAVASVQAEYNSLFEPYLAGCEGDQARCRPDSDGRQVSSNANDNACPGCADAYQLLELPLGAGKDAVNGARRELARSFHPDVFANRRGARVAEEQLKRINEACDHLLECQLSREQMAG
jgi:hypothetical protein